MMRSIGETCTPARFRPLMWASVQISPVAEGTR